MCAIRFIIYLCVNYRLKLIILCLYDAVNVATAATVVPLLTPPVVILALLGLKNAILQGSLTNRQGNQADLVAFQFHGVEQPGSMQPSSTMQASAAIDNATAKTKA